MTLSAPFLQNQYLTSSEFAQMMDPLRPGATFPTYDDFVVTSDDNTSTTFRVGIGRGWVGGVGIFNNSPAVISYPASLRSPVLIARVLWSDSTDEIDGGSVEFRVVDWDLYTPPLRSADEATDDDIVWEPGVRYDAVLATRQRYTMTNELVTMDLRMTGGSGIRSVYSDFPAMYDVRGSEVVIRDAQLWYITEHYTTGLTRVTQPTPSEPDVVEDQLTDLDGAVIPMTTFTENGVTTWISKDPQHAFTPTNHLGIYLNGAITDATWPIAAGHFTTSDGRSFPLYIIPRIESGKSMIQPIQGEGSTAWDEARIADSTVYLTLQFEV